MNFGLDATSAATVWATIGLVIFIGIAIYFGVPKMVAGMIDARIQASKTTALGSVDAIAAETAMALVAQLGGSATEADARSAVAEAKGAN